MLRKFILTTTILFVVNSANASIFPDFSKVRDLLPDFSSIKEMLPRISLFSTFPSCDNKRAVEKLKDFIPDSVLLDLSHSYGAVINRSDLDISFNDFSKQGEDELMNASYCQVNVNLKLTKDKFNQLVQDFSNKEKASLEQQKSDEEVFIFGNNEVEYNDELLETAAVIYKINQNYYSKHNATDADRSSLEKYHNEYIKGLNDYKNEMMEERSKIQEKYDKIASESIDNYKKLLSDIKPFMLNYGVAEDPSTDEIFVFQ